MSKLDNVKAYYRTHFGSEFGEPQGCSVAEVEELERTVGHHLPAAYREFLLWMGNDKDGIFRGSDWFLSDIVENTEYVDELLRENGVDWRPEGAILAFFCHQGYMIAWFDLSTTEDDPPCYFYSEGEDMTVPGQRQRFSEFVLAELEGIIAARSSSEQPQP